jgi:hypothetical protein
MTSVFDKCTNNYALLKDLSQTVILFAERTYLANTAVPMTRQLYATSANCERNGQVAKCLLNIPDVGMQLHMCMFGEAVFHNRAYN